MQRILIADMSEVFAAALEKAFRTEFEVRTCCDGISAQELLLSFQPDVLILNFTLPYKDGLTVLQEAAFVPAVILGIANYLNPYIVQTALELGVGYILQMPTVNTVRLRVTDMLQAKQGVHSPEEETKLHLHCLGIPSHLDGYRYLLAGIPLFHEDSRQLLTKELYPAIAAICGCKDVRSVEHSIRTAIERAWQHYDPNVWVKYFSPGANGKIACPSNKAFIARLAQMLP